MTDPHALHAEESFRLRNEWLDIEVAPRKFPPVVRAEDMHRECVRDEWQMARNPWVVRGRDHG